MVPYPTYGLLSPGRESHAPGMFTVSEAGQPPSAPLTSSAVSYPLLSSCAGVSRASSEPPGWGSARIIAGWKPLPLRPLRQKDARPAPRGRQPGFG